MRLVKWVSLVGLLVLAGGLVSCQQKPSAAPAAATATADAWAKVLVGHTSGMVSRHADIRVAFAADLTAAKPLTTATLSIEPAIAGKLALVGARELQFTPAEQLKPGQTYAVTLTGKDLNGLPPGLAPYRFEFNVQTPQYELVMATLESDAADSRLMTLRGTIMTADREDARAVEQMLTASHAGTALTPTWVHASDGREHGFTLARLARAEAATEAQVHVIGQPIGASRNEDRNVEVPALSAFAVLNVEAVEENGRKQIQITFSDPLDAQQNFKGLVQFSAGEFTSSVDGNQLVIFPAEEASGNVTVILDAGIRNSSGKALQEQSTHLVTLTSQKPQVRFVGNGVILPDAKTLTVPFEAVSARSVQITATQVFAENIPQFLQVNALGGNYEIGRVGRYLWKKKLSLTAPNTGRWQRYEIDVTELVRAHPNALLQLNLQLTPEDSAYACAGEPAASAADRGALVDQESSDSSMQVNWNYSEEYFGVAADATEEGEEEEDYEARWNQRKDPCKNAYYFYGYNENVAAQRNLIASNLGLLAKSDARGNLLVSVTHLGTAQPESGVQLELRNFQNRKIGTATTDGQGMAKLQPSSAPFLLIAESGGRRGYLKLNANAALPVSHFDVGGETLRKGLKGAIYGERGVWRPGDALGLTFVVRDRDATLPANHPATLELQDPRGRTTQTIVNAKPIDGFYRFDARTAADAPTGNWTAKVSLGGVTFTRNLKIETVMPNRLKVELDLGAGVLGGGKPLQGAVKSEWLSGATATGLKTDVTLRLARMQTNFDGLKDFVFDDPARDFVSEPQELFAAQLDDAGAARFSTELELESAPGMLNAYFTTRVFERGGAFSVNYQTQTYSPFARYVGVKVQQDAARRTLMVDTDQTVDIATVLSSGTPAAVSKLKLTLYKVDWRWWWDRSDDSLAAYVARENTERVREAVINTNAQGRAQWKFRLAEEQWGRYLLRICDEEGGHCTGQVLYVDWPYWSGEGRDQTGPAATMLNLTADKASYEVGQTATIQLPEAAQGRALLTIENGSSVLDARWITPTAGNARVTVPITAAMAPNAYVSVTLIQPHQGKTNDRPIRLYGVIPLVVADPATRLQPKVQTAEEWRPESEVAVKVSESQGKAMTYTLAVVDEGLLALTNFKTPDLHGEFFRREALGVRTWDLFDEVVGAYGTDLERLLALGGSDSAADAAGNKEQSRFPPVAQLLGPFQLKAGEVQERKLKLPRYVGAVRVMVIAGNNSTTPAAFGSVEKSVPVRQPLMILPTMPRVVGPGEEIAVPVAVFAMHESVRNVDLSIAPDAMFEVVGSTSTRLAFTRLEEKTGMLRLRAKNRLGRSKVRFAASSGQHRAQDEINIEVRSANAPSTITQTQLLKPGDTWEPKVVPHGIPGTNRASIEVSTLPALNLERRLSYLIGYPHGCLEQTTSAVFPQLHLARLIKLDSDAKAATERNIRAGIERLKQFQLPSGAFSYWPGETIAAGDGYHQWAAIYASHFLVEAEKLGYTVPASMRTGMIRYQRTLAQNWTAENSVALNQAYRLFVLARAGSPEIGAMNRLREQKLDNVERYMLAAAYQLAGQRDAASALSRVDPMGVRDYRRMDYTFGTPLRDHGLVLQSVVILGQFDKALPLVRAIGDALQQDSWYSTQETAYALLGVAQLAGAQPANTFTFTERVNGKSQDYTVAAAMHKAPLAIADAGAQVSIQNTSQGVLFATIAVRGTPAPQQEEAISSGLEVKVSYLDDAGQSVDPAKLKQGSDVTIDVEVRNATRQDIANIAMTQIFPSGWEIHNQRLAGEAQATGERDANVQTSWRNERDARTDYVDIRDDRIMQYFKLASGSTIRFSSRVNAAYRGRYYLPGVAVEAMYDASKQARSAGKWTEVVAQ